MIRPRGSCRARAAAVMLCGLGFLTACSAPPPGLSATTPLVGVTVAPSIVEPSEQPTTAPTDTALPSPSRIPEGSLSFVFTLATRTLGVTRYLGVGALDPQSGMVRQLTPEGHRLLDASPDGLDLLVVDGRILYRLGYAGERQTISTEYLGASTPAARWLNDSGGIAFVEGSAEADRSVVVVFPDGTPPVRLEVAGAEPVEIYPSLASTGVLWASGSCTPEGECTPERVWRSSLEGRTTELDARIRMPVLSPDGSWLAYTRAVNERDYGLFLALGDGSNPRSVHLPAEHWLDYCWSPDGSTLAAIGVERSDYSGRWTAAHHYLIVPGDLSIRELPDALGIREAVIWSPDGSGLILFATQPAEAGYRLDTVRIDLASGAIEPVDPGTAFRSESFLFLSSGDWAFLPD